LPARASPRKPRWPLLLRFAGTSTPHPQPGREAVAEDEGEREVGDRSSAIPVGISRTSPGEGGGRSPAREATNPAGPRAMAAAAPAAELEPWRSGARPCLAVAAARAPWRAPPEQVCEGGREPGHRRRGRRREEAAAVARASPWATAPGSRAVRNAAREGSSGREERRAAGEQGRGE